MTTRSPYHYKRDRPLYFHHVVDGNVRAAANPSNVDGGPGIPFVYKLDPPLPHSLNFYYRVNGPPGTKFLLRTRMVQGGKSRVLVLEGKIGPISDRVFFVEWTAIRAFKRDRDPIGSLIKQVLKEDGSLTKEDRDLLNATLVPESSQTAEPQT